MANEIYIDYASGNSLYACIRNSAGKVWNPSNKAFETWSTVDDYDIPLTDVGGDRYIGDFDTNISTGTYSIQAFLQSGASPADSDYVVGGREIIWQGAYEYLPQPPGDWREV